jgi:hypothetical protein
VVKNFYAFILNLGDYRFHNRAVGAPFPLDFPTAGHVDALVPVFLVKAQCPGRVGVEGGIGRPGDALREAVQDSPFNLDAVDALGSAPSPALFVLVVDDAPPGSGVDNKQGLAA